MAGLQGLTGLYGAQPTTGAGQVDEGALQAYDQAQQYADAHTKPGDTANQHDQYGGRYSGQGTYADNLTGQIAEFSDLPPFYVLADPDAAIDRTPSSHGGLYPRPGALGVMAQSGMEIAGEQAQGLHSSDQGGPRSVVGRAPGGHEENTAWTVDRYDAPNQNALSRNLADQVRPMSGSNGRSADVDQGYGVPNTLPEFQRGHSIRYVQHDELKFDRSLTGPANEGIWLGKFTQSGPSFAGPDSPYGVMGQAQGMMTAERRGFPTEYTQPASPTVLPTSQSSGQDVWASNRLGGL